jgi:hypothetical protein
LTTAAGGTGAGVEAIGSGAPGTAPRGFGCLADGGMLVDLPRGVLVDLPSGVLVDLARGVADD